MGSPIIAPPMRDQVDLLANIPPPRNEGPMLQANNPPPRVEQLNITPPRDDQALLELDIPPIRDFTSYIQRIERLINEQMIDGTDRAL